MHQIIKFLLLHVTRAALNGEIPSATKISIWHNMVVLWNSHTVKKSRCWFCLIEIRHYISRGPITLLLCVLRVHWCIDCETVSEQHQNKQETVSQSQCIPPQCKQISFGIKNESEVQGQSRINRNLNSPKMHLWPRFGNPNLNSWWVMVWTSSKWSQFWVWS